MHEGSALHRPDGLADSLARTKTAPDKKRGPGNLGGGTRGRRTMGGVRPHLDYARPTAPIKRGEHSAGPAQLRALFDVGYFPQNTPPGRLDLSGKDFNSHTGRDQAG